MLRDAAARSRGGRERRDMTMQRRSFLTLAAGGAMAADCGAVTGLPGSCW